jgi:hypothetical protein
LLSKREFEIEAELPMSLEIAPPKAEPSVERSPPMAWLPLNTLLEIEAELPRKFAIAPPRASPSAAPPPPMA